MKKLNTSLAVFLAMFAGIELMLVSLERMDAADRIIDAKVLIAFITAVTVQVGTIALTGSKWFFQRWLAVFRPAA